MRVAILFNDEVALAYGEPHDVVALQAERVVVEAIGAVCRDLGFEPRAVAFDGSAPEAEIVFNTVEGILEPVAAEVLERAGATFTGSSSRTLATARDKELARAALAAAAVPVPPGCVLRTGEEPLTVRYPAIVKPAREDASLGVTPESVVADEATARARARYVIERYRQPALVEEFLPGAEYGVSLLGGEVLPLAETVHPACGIVSYAAKWLADSEDYRTTFVVAHDDSPAVVAVARAAWVALGLRDYGRVDVRLSATGEPFAIDVNPNPDLSPDSGLALAAARGGLSHADVIARIVEGALARDARASPVRP